MQSLMRQLQNPWILSAIAATGAYFAVEKMKPELVFNADGSLKNPMINSMTVAAAVAVVVLGSAKMRGRPMRLPGMKSPLEQAMDRREGLLGPESFKM